MKLIVKHGGNLIVRFHRTGVLGVLLEKGFFLAYIIWSPHHVYKGWRASDIWYQRQHTRTFFIPPEKNRSTGIYPQICYLYKKEEEEEEKIVNEQEEGNNNRTSCSEMSTSNDDDDDVGVCCKAPRIHHPPGEEEEEGTNMPSSRPPVNLNMYIGWMLLGLNLTRERNTNP